MTAVERQARRAVGVTGEVTHGSLREAVAAGPGWLPLLVLAALSGTVLAQGCALLLAPDIARSLGRSTATTGTLLGLWSAGVALGLPFALRAGLGGRRVRWTAWGAGALALSLVSLACADSPVTVAGSALLAGAGSAVCGAGARDLLSDLYAPLGLTHVVVAHRAVALLVGGAALTVTFPVAQAADLTWRAAVLVLGAATALLAVLTTVIAEPVRGAQESAAVQRLVGGAPDVPEGRPGFAEGVRRLLAIPTVRPALVVLAAVTALGYAAVVFGGYALEQRADVPYDRVPVVLVVAAWVSALVAARMSGHAALELGVGPRGLARDAAALLVLAGVALVVVGVVPWWPAVAAGLVAVASCLVLVVVAVDRLVTAVVPPGLRGVAAALVTGYSGVLGVAAGGGAVAAVDGSLGLAWTMPLLAVVAGVAALLLRRVAGTVLPDLDHAVDVLVEAQEMASQRARGVHAPLLSCRKVSFSYGPLQILFDVDFTVDDGEMVALLGTNGAGKSTLLRVISGLGIPSSGSVRISGQDVTYAEPGDRVRLGVSQIPGGKAVFGPLSVVENLRMYGYALGRDRRAVDRGIDEAFATFPRLAERRNAPASTMSGGEQQMLALSKALILSPRLLLIDELSLGLAPKVVGELLSLVRTINAAGTSVVLVEQSVNVALSLAEHAYFMEKGQVRFDGRTEDLLARPDILRSVFLSGVAAGTAT